jgi:uncharacterized MAPEG superfamily protein
MGASNAVLAGSFTLAYWCVLVAALLPYVCASLAKAGGVGKSRRDGGFDNHDPRAWLAQQKGRHARANAAQANSFEGLPFFIGAVVIAHQLGAAQGWLDWMALGYVVCRVAFIALYVADKATARSLVWTVGLLLNIGILLLGWH